VNRSCETFGNLYYPKVMKHIPSLFRCRIALTLLCIGLTGASVSASSNLDDTAKILAGLPPAPGSPLESLTQDPGWKNQAAQFSQTWQKFDERQLSRVRAWADRELPTVRDQAPVLYYTFSGPDIAYANAFFPNCKTYVLCGLEPLGSVPDLEKFSPGKLSHALGQLYGSLKTILALSFFKTKDMGSDFRNCELPGTTPVLMTFLARMGKTVRSVDFVTLDRDGNEQLRDDTGATSRGDGMTPGVKITFDSGPGTSVQTVYFFTADISNDGLKKNPGFANFCRKQEPGAGLVKAASYLMHTDSFSATRDFLMERCKFLLQDDTGIPAKVFVGSNWNVKPYGHYVKPIELFSGYYQKDLAKLYSGKEQEPLQFGIGYYHSLDQCNMVLASRDPNSVVVTVAPVVESSMAPKPSVSTETLASSAIKSTEVESKQAKRSLPQLEDEELRIRQDTTLPKAERLRKLHEVWKLQLAVMGKNSA
jgi:hypothetical protein